MSRASSSVVFRAFLAALGHAVRGEEHNAGEQQDAAHRRRVVAHGLHLVLDGQHQEQGQGGHDQQQNLPPGGGGLSPAGGAGEQIPKEAEELQDHLPDVTPVVDAHRNQGCKVEQDVEQVVRSLIPKKC